MVSIKINNVGSENSPRAEAIRRTLEGQTFMNFKVNFCPIGGSCDVVVETDYTDDETEVKDFLLHVLSSGLK